jgi:alkanesulfonate monooxygenase SsuD/methylene tetrahydromethanopterin reductase-like flavin-dependent oxidoreductase (luciferase family)
VTVDPNQARGVMNQLLYPIDGAPDLTDATAERLVDNVIGGRLFAASVTDFAEAIDQTLRAGALHPQTADLSRRFSEPELLEFLRRVARHLDDRRPRPTP